MINSRFAVAIHILALLDASKEMHTTSEFLAQSIGTNPVVVRRIAKLFAGRCLRLYLVGTATRLGGEAVRQLGRD